MIVDDLQQATASARRSSTTRSRVARESLFRRLLALTDTTAAAAAVVVAVVVSGGRLDLLVWATLFLPVWIVLAKLLGLYDRDQRSLRHLTVDELPALITWATSGTGLLALLLLATPTGSIGGSAMWMWIVAWSTALALRGSVRAVWRRTTPPAQAAIVGEGALAVALRRKLELFPDIHVQLVAELPTVTLTELREDDEWATGVDRLMLATQLDEVVVRELVLFCRARHIRLSIVPPVPALFGTAVQLNHLAELPLIEYSTWPVSRSTLLLKRALDIVVSSVALVLAAPLAVAIAVAIAASDGGPALFRQQRASAGGRPFAMLKFRTMVPEAEELLPTLVRLDELEKPMFKLVGDPRVTRIGAFLRRWSLDELPQLVNVLRGDMSLVGPRPEQVELVARYAPEHRFRLAVKPGMTGPMQVFGRGRLTFEERLAVERDYVETMSIPRDLRIIAMTLSAIISGRGAY